jgi:hypothetical protein
MSGSRHSIKDITIDPTPHQRMLIIAITENDLATIHHLLLKEKLDPNFAVLDVSALTTAILKGSFESVNELLNNGANPNFGGIITSLGAAVGVGMDTLELLLSQPGIDVDVCNRRGETALMTAAQKGNLAAAQRLIATGANPKATTQDGKTAADYASENSHVEVAKYLAEQAKISTMPKATTTNNDSLAKVFNSLYTKVLPLAQNAIMKRAIEEALEKVEQLEADLKEFIANYRGEESSMATASTNSHPADLAYDAIPASSAPTALATVKYGAYAMPASLFAALSLPHAKRSPTSASNTAIPSQTISSATKSTAAVRKRPMTDASATSTVPASRTPDTEIVEVCDDDYFTAESMLRLIKQPNAKRQRPNDYGPAPK